MDVRFRTPELEKWFTDKRERTKALGDQIARAYVKQIQLLQAAQDTLALAKIPQLHFKAMAKGSPVAGKHTVRLSGFMRLILTIEGNVVTVEEVSKHHEEWKDQGPAEYRPGPGNRGVTMMQVESARESTRILPDEAIPPGEHLADALRELGISQSELARRMGRPQQAINEIVRGVKAITAETALQLEAATGVPAHVWVRLEADYRLVKARLALAGPDEGVVSPLPDEPRERPRAWPSAGKASWSRSKAAKRRKK